LKRAAEKKRTACRSHDDDDDNEGDDDGDDVFIKTRKAPGNIELVLGKRKACGE
jgi:hypothetical protein